ncbi:hypothetical protein FB565_003204 [Actinoplanes lutulentus]|uniref:Uncharacterized protein n=1 Tax=Actinoplanes lutulentus TaxID=1287878 RepID=A0A327YXF0_9ACTN|nr:DUF5995 family protein [Actinoplanes lutulentus]MBB2943491.1 hypothetical protein [Actinoplanes lutulentus]RAK25990.1 hypothetical protein B0I29_12924 [Actinoplanes lutulentus]
MGASAARLRECRQELTGYTGGGAVNGWTPVAQEMADACRVPPEDIAGVVARLKELQLLLNQLPPSPEKSRIGQFNTLYLTITEQVEAHLGGKEVTDRRWLEVLDVEFARLYFKALASWGTPDIDTPDAWEVLFRRSHQEEISTLEAAVLGVNAHINHDLALALIATWERLGYIGDGPQHPDYLLVNRIFYKEIPPLRRRFANAWQMEIDRCVGEVDDWSQRVLVRTTRAWAWEQAERLWELKDNEKDFLQACTLMDRAATIAGETLLRGAGIVRVLWLTVTAPVRNVWRKVRRRQPKAPVKV